MSADLDVDQQAPSEARPKPPAKTGLSRSPLMFRRGPAADVAGSDIAIPRDLSEGLFYLKHHLIGAVSAAGK